MKLFSLWSQQVGLPLKANYVWKGIKTVSMQKFRVIHGYNNGDVKWCVVCVDDGIQNAPICSPIFDKKDQAEAAMEDLLRLTDVEKGAA